MVNKVSVTKKKEKIYTFLIGLRKTVKNLVITMGPTFIALLAGVKGEYAWLAGGIVYMIKNYLENS